MYSIEQINQMNKEQFQAVEPDLLWRSLFDKKGKWWLSVEQISWLTAEQISDLTSLVGSQQIIFKSFALKIFTKEQFQAIAPNSLWNSLLDKEDKIKNEWLPVEKISYLTAEQIWYLTTRGVEFDLTLLSKEQFQAVAPHSLWENLFNKNGNLKDEITKKSKSSDTEIENLTKERISWLTPKQIWYLTSNNKIIFEHFSLVEALSKEQIQAIAPHSLYNSVKKFSFVPFEYNSKRYYHLISSLSAEQVSYLTSNNEWFDIISLKCLSKEQIQAIAPDSFWTSYKNIKESWKLNKEVSWLTVEQVSYLTTKGVELDLTLLSEEQIQAVAPDSLWRSYKNIKESWKLNKEVSWLTVEQVSYLTTKGVELDLTLLSKEQFQAVAPDSLWRSLFDKKGKFKNEWLSIEQISWLTVEQVSYLTTKGIELDLTLLSKEQFQAVAPDSLWRSLFDKKGKFKNGWLSVEQISWLTDKQTSELDLKVIDKLGKDFLIILSKEKFSSFVKWFLKLKPVQFSWLSPEFISALSPEDIKKISKEQFQALTCYQVQSLNTNQIKALYKHQIDILLEWKLLYFTKEQFKGLGKYQFQQLKKWQIQALTEKQLSILDEEQVSYFTEKQWKWFTEQQKEIIDKKLQNSKVPNFSFQESNFLPPENKSIITKITNVDVPSSTKESTSVVVPSSTKEITNVVVPSSTKESTSVVVSSSTKESTSVVVPSSTKESTSVVVSSSTLLVDISGSKEIPTNLILTDALINKLNNNNLKPLARLTDEKVEELLDGLPEIVTDELETNITESGKEAVPVPSQFYF